MEELEMIRQIVEVNITLVEQELKKDKWNVAQIHGLNAVLKTHENYLTYIKKRQNGKKGR